MAKNPTPLDDSLQKAAQSVAALVLQQAIASLAGSMTMGELIDSMAQTQYNAQFREMSLNAFIDVRGGGGAKKSSSGTGFNTRTQAGREEIDLVVAGYLEKAGTSGAEQIREGIGGGTAAQIRESVGRLQDQGLVSKSGEKRATKYTWKGKTAKKGK